MLPLRRYISVSIVTCQFSELNSFKYLQLTANSKITNYSSFYKIGRVMIISVLFTTNSTVERETLFTLPVNADAVVGVLLPVNNGTTAQISINKNIVRLENSVPANVTVGGILVF